MDKKTFNKHKDIQKPLAIQFHLEEINHGSIKPNTANSFSMGFDAGVSFALNLINEMPEKPEGE